MIIYAVWFFSKPFLLVLCGGYVFSGIVVRLVGSVRRALVPQTGYRRTGLGRRPEAMRGGEII